MAIDSYLNLITSQHRNKPNFITWLSSALNKVDDGITAANSIPSVFSISGAKLGTTNLVKNSGVEVVTQTATLFSDALTSYTGSTVPAPWTLQSGSFTFGASGATSGANGSVITAGNAAWKPVLGSDGTTHLGLSSKATFSIPTAMPSGGSLLAAVYLWIDTNHYYFASINEASNNLGIFKYVNGTYTNIVAPISFTPTTSATYMFDLTLLDNGNLSLAISGYSTQNLSGTDSSPLTGGFLIGVGGDTGVVISNASCVGPWANSWTIGGDSRVAWGLTQSAIGGKYSVSAVGVSGVGGWIYGNAASATAGQTYTLSQYVNPSASGALVELLWSGGTNINTTVVANSNQRYSVSGTAPTGTTTATAYFNTGNSAGTFIVDNIQLEQGSTATNYVENDSLSYPASTYSDQLNIIGQSIGADRDVGVQLFTGTSILDDAHYQTYLNAKISANQWDGTTPGLYKIWSSVFPGSSLKITDNQDMTISLTISGITDSVVEEMINDGLIIPKPMGVKISSITFGTVLIYNKLDTQTWNTVQTYTWDQLEMQSF